MHPLDNVIWQALTTRQANFAEVCRMARRFPRDVTSLTAFSKSDSEGYASVGELVGLAGTAALFLHEPYRDRPGWELAGGAPLLEMVSENASSSEHQTNQQPGAVELNSQNSAEMVELATLTKPGPFGTRTHELGTYLGIRVDGKLVAMAGERLKVPGFTEVSAVCTHPEHTGKGYAASLMVEVMRRIRERGEVPFLHVRQDNARAIALYERLGFRTRMIVHYVVLRSVREAASPSGAESLSRR